MANSNTNSFARVVVREATNQTKIHEYTPLEAKVINNGRKKPDELFCKLPMSNRAGISDTIHYIEDTSDLTYCDAIWNFQMSVRDERGYNFDPSKRAYTTIECNGVLFLDNCFVNGLQYTAVNGAKTSNGQFDRSGTDVTTAADLADSINNDTRIPDFPFDVVAVIGTGVDTDKLFIYALPAGVAGNVITITSNENLRLTLESYPVAIFELGADLDVIESRFKEAKSGKYEGSYYLEFANSGEEVDIPIEGQAYQTGNGVGLQGRWNLDGQFDINIWTSPNLIPGIGNATPVIWSQYDGTYGLDIGLYEDGTTGNWYLRVRYAFGSGETILLGTTAKVFEEGVTDQLPRHIRVCRGGDDIIKMFTMGTQDATVSIAVASSLENPAGRLDIRFGSDSGGTLDYAGKLHQVKLYSGNTITEAEFIRNVGAKAQPIHMKFGGNIWGKDDKTTIKDIKAQGYSKDLNNFKITEDFITKLSLASVARGAVGGRDAYYTGNKSPALDTGDPSITDFYIENNGSIQSLYVLTTTANQVTQYSLTGNTYDLSSAVLFSPTQTFSVNAQNTQPKGIHVLPAGNIWFMCGSNTPASIFKYTMGVNYKIDSSSYASNSFNVSGKTTNPVGCHVNTTHMYILDTGKVYEYTLGTSLLPSTAMFTNELDVSAQDNSMSGMDFDINGEHMYLVGSENNKIYHYELTTAWDILSAVLSDDFSIADQSTAPKGVVYTGSSDRVLVIDSGSKLAYKYQQRSTHAFAAANRYGAGEMDDIIRDLINNLDPTFLVRTLTTFPTQWVGSFLADGKFDEIVNLLLVRGNLTYYVNARKVLIIEKAIEFSTEQITNHQFYQLDDTINTKTTGGQSLGGVAGVFNSYRITGVDSNDGKLINEITLLGARDQSGTVRVTNSQVVQEGDTVHSLRINVPQISIQADLDAVRDAIITLSNNIKPQYKVEAPINIHHVRFNHLVKIFNAMTNIDGDILGYMKVEAIESNYPSGKTTLTINEYPINFFELAGTETTQVNGLQSDTAIPVVFLSADLL